MKHSEPVRKIMKRIVVLLILIVQRLNEVVPALFINFETLKFGLEKGKCCQLKLKCLVLDLQHVCLAIQENIGV